ncbi:hypothetical protein [Streptomyces sp. NPDC088864]|uniref:hypothetical protein n=1 Tax=Streptomyces sp. NPDC088864 TaxID=3365910 RepID=UPI00380B7577
MFGGFVDVLGITMGLGCAWLGCRTVLRPHRPPEPFQGPVWAARAGGLGFVLLGVVLAVRSAALLAGRDAGWTGDVIRWVAGPLVIGSILAALLSRRGEHRRGEHRRAEDRQSRTRNEDGGPGRAAHR